MEQTNCQPGSLISAICGQSVRVAVAGALLLFTQMAPGEVPVQRLKSFGYPEQSSGNPSGLLVGADGALYGTGTNGGLYSAGTVFRMNLDGSGFTLLHAFSTNGGDGQFPLAGLVQGKDGTLYGTTSVGGSNNVGIIFKLSTSGTGYTILHHFDPFSDGSAPEGPLVVGKDGALYGTTTTGGSQFRGAVFRSSTDGATYQVLYAFGGFSDDGATPFALIQGADGLLYGTTRYGGTNGNGTVFKLGIDGSNYAILYSFAGPPTDGASPVALVQGRNGALYGATIYGGSYHGTLFTIKTDGSGYSSLHTFSGTLGDGANPGAGLIEGVDGAFYGTTLNGGSRQDAGTIYKFNADGTGYHVIHRLDVITSIILDFGTDGQQPGPLVQAGDGRLYGATLFGGTTGQGIYQSSGVGTIFTLSTDGTDYSVVYNFSQSGGDGANPPAGLILGRDGTFYGTTSSGGLGGQGTVFKVNADGGGYGVVYNFGLNAIDGLAPAAGLTQGTDGALYGTTTQGGYEGGDGSGTLYKVNPDGSGYTLLHSFSYLSMNDGDTAQSPPIQGQDGQLYGTMSGGGYSSDWGGFGMLYKANTEGTDYSILHLFNTNSLEGQSPRGSMIQGRDGVLYGTTFGGVLISGFGLSSGNVFKVLADGSGFQVLHTFTNNGVDGLDPSAALMQGADGALYGTTFAGGSNNSSGTVFKLSPDGSGYKILYHFGSNATDGQNPAAALVQGTDGALYGTTPSGGAYHTDFESNGTIFKLNTDGTGYTVLYNFGANPGDGRSPQGALVQGRDGGFYGATMRGGDMDAGTIFRMGSPLFEFTSLSLLANKTVSLSISGATNTICRIDASTDLANWATLVTLTNASGIVTFIDSSAPNFPKRFYRALQSQ